MSMSEGPLNAELAAVEATLAGLVPAESSLDRDRVMYLAGRASVRPAKSPRLWQATSVAATLAACALGAALLGRTGPEVVIERVVVQPSTPDVAHVESDSAPLDDFDAEAETRRIRRTATYLRACNMIATRGLDAIPSRPLPETVEPTPRRPQSLRDLLDELQRKNG